MGPFLPPCPRWSNLTKMFSLFNIQPNRPRASPASFKHVGQVLYSRGFKFGENGPIKIWVHFCLQDRGGQIWPKFLVFSTYNLIGLGPPLQLSSMYCRSSTQLASNLGKRADQNLGPFLPPGPQWSNLTKIFSLFNTQPNRPRASPASSKHVGQVLYSRGLKFRENGPIKIWVHFCLQVCSGRIWPKFLVLSTHNLIGPGPIRHVGQVLYSRGFKFGKNGPIKIWVHFCL